VDKEVRGLFGPYRNQAAGAAKKGENRRVDMLEHDRTTGTTTMTDNFITDGAGVGAKLGEPLKLLAAAEQKKIKKYVDGTGPPGFEFVPLGSGMQGEMTEATIKWLKEAALAAAKQQSDNPGVIEKLKKRNLMRFVQRLSVALMKAQAALIFNHAVDQRRHQFISNARSHGRRATHSRARGPAAGRFRAGGGRGPAPRAGHGR